jgi:hypothetical protein
VRRGLPSPAKHVAQPEADAPDAHRNLCPRKSFQPIGRPWLYIADENLSDHRPIFGRAAASGVPTVPKRPDGEACAVDDALENDADSAGLVRKAVNLFSFLGRTQQLLVRPVRTVDKFENALWFGGLPEHQAVHSAHRDWRLVWM